MSGKRSQAVLICSHYFCILLVQSKTTITSQQRSAARCFQVLRYFKLIKLKEESW